MKVIKFVLFYTVLQHFIINELFILKKLVSFSEIKLLTSNILQWIFYINNDLNNSLKHADLGRSKLINV